MFYKFCQFLTSFFFITSAQKKHWVTVSYGDFIERYNLIFLYALNAIPRSASQSSFNGPYAPLFCAWCRNLQGASDASMWSFGSWTMKYIVTSYFQCLYQLQSRNKHSDYNRQIILVLLPSEDKVGTMADQLLGMLSAIQNFQQRPKRLCVHL